MSGHFSSDSGQLTRNWNSFLWGRENWHACCCVNRIWYIKRLTYTFLQFTCAFQCVFIVLVINRNHSVATNLIFFTLFIILYHDTESVVQSIPDQNVRAIRLKTKNSCQIQHRPLIKMWTSNTWKLSRQKFCNVFLPKWNKYLVQGPSLLPQHTDFQKLLSFQLEWTVYCYHLQTEKNVANWWICTT